MNESGGDGGTHARRRPRGFGAHLLAYFAVMAVLIGATVNRRGHNQIDERDDLKETRRYEKP